MSKTARVNSSGVAFIDDLLTPSKWADGLISYGFATSGTAYGSGYGSGEVEKGFAPLNAKQKAAATDAFAAWADVAAISFTEVSATSAVIRLASSDAPRTSWAYGPSAAGFGGDVWIGSAGYNQNPVQGNYAYITIMHEIGHALGLGHPHEGGHGHVGASWGAPAAIDAMPYSIMSYRSYAGARLTDGYVNETWGHAQTPMLRDIAALQYLYGANYETRATDTVYRWSETTGEKFINGVGQGAPGGNRIFETVWDGGGRDTFDFSAFTSDLEIDLQPGGWSDLGTGQLARLGHGHTAPGNIAIAHLFQGDARALIENAVGGAGDDVITGNFGDNLLIGGAGADTLTGLGGRNILVGDALGDELDLIGLDAAGLIAITLPTIRAADAGDDILIGGEHNDVFIPGLGSNTVTGGGGEDTLILDFPLTALTIEGDAATGLTITYEGGEVSATGIEFLAVSDGIYALSGTDPLGSAEYVDEIALLYRAGLGRDLDAGGLDYWLGAIRENAEFGTMAQSLIDSPEFAARFGTPETMSSAEFVGRLYENVLGRAGTDGELGYWTATMAAGQSQCDVLLAFAMSDENRDGLATGAGTPIGDPLDLVSVSPAQWAELWA